MTDLATITAILYGARLQRRIPETAAEQRGAIIAAINDARLIVAAVNEDEAARPITPIRDDLAILAQVCGTSMPEQPPPSPGIIGRTTAEAKAPRRRG